MSVHVSLNLLNELGKIDKGKASQAFLRKYCFYPVNFIIYMQKYECYMLFII